VRLLVGLGNPGPRYFGTRHNLGFELIDRLARRHGIAVNAARCHGQLGRGEIAGQAVLLFKPMTFMNLSGLALAELTGEWPGLEIRRDLLLVYDDLDLACGQLRVRERGGPGGHNGVSDVVARLGTQEFARLRFGIGRPAGRETISEHVLSPFAASERALVEERTEAALDSMEAFVERGAENAIARAAEAGSPTRPEGTP